MKLETGTNYAATITLDFLERIASNGDIKEKFESIGFTQVQVVGSGRIRTAKGKWAGSTREVEIPEQVSNIEKL